jgi:hypothetical protein
MTMMGGGCVAGSAETVTAGLLTGVVGAQAG